MQGELFLAGPTAVGKSAVAMRLSELLKGEIVSVDSMQVYRGLDIGTAKPAAEELQRVPHHVVSIVDLSETFDAAGFVAQAKVAAKNILARGHTPIFCGGTGLYFKAYVAGLGESPGTDSGLREVLEKTPLPVLLQELEELDPAAFAIIDRKNPRRVIRAVEVIRRTGKPFSLQRAQWRNWPRDLIPRTFVLQREPEDLKDRIDARVEMMFAQGLVAETERLLSTGLQNNRIAMQALGYRQVAAHLRGELSLPEGMELVKSRTRQFAKRQLTWFRRQMEGHWIVLRPDEQPDESANQILQLLRCGSV